MKRWMLRSALLMGLLMATGIGLQNAWAAKGGNGGGNGGGNTGGGNTGGGNTGGGNTGGGTAGDPTPDGVSQRELGRRIHFNYDDISNTVATVPGPTS